MYIIYPCVHHHRGFEDTWCNVTSGMNAHILYNPQCQYSHN